MSERPMPHTGPKGETYESNSKLTHESHEKRIEKVVKGNVKTRKKSLGRKVQDTFISEDVENVKGYILFDVIVPAVKDIIDDIVVNSLRMILYGDTKSGKERRKGGGTYISYNSYSQPNNRRQTSVDKRKSFNDFQDIIFESRGEAEEVLSNLVDIVIDYGVATVADLYDLVGVTGSFTDNKYGWTDLKSASVVRVREGYLIQLPKAAFVE